jgi:hypothetical protein
MVMIGLGVEVLAGPGFRRRRAELFEETIETLCDGADWTPSGLSDGGSKLDLLRRIHRSTRRSRLLVG